jgi:hypothetical protein
VVRDGQRPLRKGTKLVWVCVYHCFAPLEISGVEYICIKEEFRECRKKSVSREEEDHN